MPLLTMPACRVKFGQLSSRTSGTKSSVPGDCGCASRCPLLSHRGSDVRVQHQDGPTLSRAIAVVMMHSKSVTGI
jgi:hypothetical protein